MSKLLNQERPVVESRRARLRQVPVVPAPKPPVEPAVEPPPPAAEPVQTAAPPVEPTPVAPQPGPRLETPPPPPAPVPTRPAPAARPSPRRPAPPHATRLWWPLVTLAVAMALFADLWSYSQQPPAPADTRPESSLSTTAMPRALPTLFGIRVPPRQEAAAAVRRAQAMDQALTDAQRVVRLMETALRHAAGTYAATPPAGAATQLAAADRVR